MARTIKILLLEDRPEDAQFALGQPQPGFAWQWQLVDTMQRGAADFVLKNQPRRVVTAVIRALLDRQLRQDDRDTQQLLRLRDRVLRACIIAIIIADSRGIIRWANTAFTGLTGYQSGGSRANQHGHVPGTLNVIIAQATRVDLLVTDTVMLVGLSGRDLARQRHDQQPDLKVLLISLDTSEICDTGFRNRERIQFQPKPKDAQTLNKTVSRCLYHQQPIP